MNSPRHPELSSTQSSCRFLSARAWLLSFAGLGMVLMGGCTGVTGISRAPEGNSQNAQAIDVTPRSDRPLTPTEADTNFVVEVVERVESAVVQINTLRTVDRQSPDAFSDPFRRFFGDSAPTAPRERTERGIGSGFVIDASGVILTNAHVVDGADTVNVVFPDGREFEGRVLGADTLTDIAVVRVPTNNLPTPQLGNSEQVRPGQWAIAIGNPLGLQETVTVGVVSGIDRSSSDLGVGDKRVGFIQTDAAINPGNSGGPLLNARGEVIGVNTAIIGGAQGIGFAIPINTARRIAQQLITEGRVEHPYMGVQLVPVTESLKQRLEERSDGQIQIEASEGVLVVQVASGSPAAQAGLRPGDVIQSINNQPVTAPNQVQRFVEEVGVGEQMQVQIQRGDRAQQIAVRLRAIPNQS